MNISRYFLYTSTALVAASISGSAFAQSTGAVDFERDIVVTATKAQGVGGVVVPQTSKSKSVLTQEVISTQSPGQSINSIINLVPGVSFQNNDPFGSSGGTMTIHGFDSSRVSQTFDGIPLNDTGNYALYSGQQVDPEIIEQVNVNLGSTDVDSPTAAATGSTVNIRTRDPLKDFHFAMNGSAGSYHFFRVQGILDTGEFTALGTRLLLEGSHASNNAVYGRIGKLSKYQANGKLYQPIGGNGDFVSIAGHYNRNVNNFFGSVPLRLDGGRPVFTDSSGRFPYNKDERRYAVPRCQTAAAVMGAVDTPNACGTAFDERYNPSNTGNIRGNSRFTLTDGLVLTVDPSYQYVLANGGGTVNAKEGTLAGRVGYLGGTPYAGRDLNGDTDTLDTVKVLAPSTTQTHRYGVIASLRYDFAENHSVRLNYTWDRGRHRQTGEVGLLERDGSPFNVFPRDNPQFTSTGFPLQKRDRLSIAILSQFSGEYRGKFFGNRLTVNLGVRAPRFTRKLDQRCFTTRVNGDVDCFGGDMAAAAAYALANPYSYNPTTKAVTGFAPPQKRTFKYDKILPNGGILFNITPALSIYANYSKGLQVPGTDSLYQSFWFPAGVAVPKPETTDNFDIGVRYATSKFLLQGSLWKTNYKNRLASSYDPVVDKSVYTNLGDVNRWGIDGSVAYKPIPELTGYIFGSYLKSKIKDNVQKAGGSGYNCSNASMSNPADVTNCAFTKGKRESLSPVYTLGGRIEGTLGPVTLGIQAKRTGQRYYNDQNLPVVSGANVIYGARIPAYTLVDLDARLSLEKWGAKDVWLQLNVTNLFDKLYVGGTTTSSQLLNTSVTFHQIGAPRAVMGTLHVGL